MILPWIRLKAWKLPGFGHWDRVAVLGRRIVGGRPEVFQKGSSLVSVSTVHERNKAALLLSLSKVPTSTDLIGRPVQRYKVSRLLILTSGVVGSGLFALLLGRFLPASLL